MRPNGNLLDGMLADLAFTNRESIGSRNHEGIEGRGIYTNLGEAFCDEEDPGLCLEDFTDHPSKRYPSERVARFIANGSTADV